jgi:DNA-binding NarL/FixJ family response regulator
MENYKTIKDQLECNKNKYVLKNSTDYNEFKEIIAKEEPEIALIDLLIEGRPRGISMLQWVRKHFPKIKCIILSEYREHILECAESGALGYLLLKNLDGFEDAIKSVYNEVPYFKDIVGVELAKQVSRRNSIDKPLKEFLGFTVRERMILCFIGMKLSYKQMSKLLGKSTKTIRNQAQTLIEKAGVNKKYDAYLKYRQFLPSECPLKKCNRKVTHSKFKYENTWPSCFWPVVNMTVKCPMARKE